MSNTTITLCELGLKILGEKTIRWRGPIDITEAPEGYVVSIPGHVYGLRFNREGLQTDDDWNILGDPCYWLEIE